jgi:hypothetical protein
MNTNVKLGDLLGAFGEIEVELGAVYDWSL